MAPTAHAALIAVAIASAARFMVLTPISALYQGIDQESDYGGERHDGGLGNLPGPPPQHDGDRHEKRRRKSDDRASAQHHNGARDRADGRRRAAGDESHDRRLL